MQRVSIGKNQAGQRLDKFLRKFLPEANNSFIYKMLRKKNITLNGKKAEGSEILSLDDIVTFFFSEETYQKFTGTGQTAARPSLVSASLEYEKAYQNIKNISVIYEDDNILLANKPVGVLSQKAADGDISVNEWLIGYLLSKGDFTTKELQNFRPSICNRLDRNTSGLILCGKSLPGTQFLNECVRNRNIGKFYRTICVGIPEGKATIKGYLHKDHDRNTVSISSQTSDNGTDDYIETRYQVIQAFHDYSLLEIELITGKTHQIRAHLSSIHHPIMGDFKYGNKKHNQIAKESFGLTNQLLHAYRVEFPVFTEGPGVAVSGKSFVAPLPQQFQMILKNLQEK